MLAYHVVGGVSEVVVGTSPVATSVFGDVAQRLVQRLHKALVGGSNPPIATIQPNMVATHRFNHKRLKDDFRWRHWCSGNMSACDAEVLGSTPR